MTIIPDFIFDPNNWEATYPWDDRSELLEHYELRWEAIEEPLRFSTLIRGPDKWAVSVVLTRDETGEPDETEVQWFDSEEEAKAAIARGKP